jgi:hypothetical protein
MFTSSIQKHIAVTALGISICFGMVAMPGITQAQVQDEQADEIKSLHAMVTILQQQSASDSSVQYERVSVRENLSVRTFPGGPLLTVLDPETSGTVLFGPTNVNGFDWQFIIYDNGVVGWSADEWLVFSGTQDANIVPASIDSDEKCTTEFGVFGSGTILSSLVSGIPPVELAEVQFACESTQWVVYEVEEEEVVEPGTPGSCEIEGVYYPNGSTSPSITVDGTVIEFPDMQFVCTDGILDLQPLPERFDELDLADIDFIQVVRRGSEATVVVVLKSGESVSTFITNDNIINRVVSFLIDDNNLDISAYADESVVYETVEDLTTIILDSTVDNPLPEVVADVDDSDDDTAVEVLEEEEEEESTSSSNSSNGRSSDATPNEVVEEEDVEEEVVSEEGSDQDVEVAATFVEEVVVQNDDQDDPNAVPVVPVVEEEEEVLNNGR